MQRSSPLRHQMSLCPWPPLQCTTPLYRTRHLLSRGARLRGWLQRTTSLCPLWPLRRPLQCTTSLCPWPLRRPLQCTTSLCPLWPLRRPLQCTTSLCRARHLQSRGALRAWLQRNGPLHWCVCVCVCVCVCEFTVLQPHLTSSHHPIGIDIEAPTPIIRRPMSNIHVQFPGFIVRCIFDDEWCTVVVHCPLYYVVLTLWLFSGVAWSNTLLAGART